MTNKTIEPKAKRLAQGWRKHVRRLKAASRKIGAAPGLATGAQIHLVIGERA